MAAIATFFVIIEVVVVLVTVMFMIQGIYLSNPQWEVFRAPRFLWLMLNQNRVCYQFEIITY